MATKTLFFHKNILFFCILFLSLTSCSQEKLEVERGNAGFSEINKETLERISYLEGLVGSLTSTTESSEDRIAFLETDIDCLTGTLTGTQCIAVKYASEAYVNAVLDELDTSLSASMNAISNDITNLITRHNNLVTTVSGNANGIAATNKAVGRLTTRVANLEAPNQGWIEPTLANDWEHVNGAYGAAQAGYFKDKIGRVHFRGSVHRGNCPQSAGDPAVVIFILPSTHRPDGGVRGFRTAFTPDNSPIWVHVTPFTGEVRVASVCENGATSLQLDGISFQADIP